MIIYGYKHRLDRIAGGLFHCPNCQTQRTYDHMNLMRIFTLFFIPLFPLGRESTFIECTTCGYEFKPEALLGTPGNEQFGHELEARNAVRDIQNRKKRGMVTAVLGVMLGAVGTLAFLILVVFQLTSGSDPTEGLLGLFLMMCICPIPLMVVGAALLAWGFRIRQKAAKDMNTPVVQLR